MSIVRVALKEVAPAKPLKNRPAGDDLVWHLNLDQVEANSGRVLEEKLAPASEAGNSTHWFDENHVLYSKLRPYLNKVVVPEKNGVATTELVPLRPDPKRLDRRYLAYYLRSDQFVNWVNVQVAGAKMPRVSMKVFWEHEIPLPSLPEQRRIAAILDKADAVRRKRQQAIRLTEEFLRSVFLDMFGDPVTNPKGFDKQPLGELIKLKSGDFLPAKSMDPHGVYPVYGGNGINGKHSEYMFENATIVLGRVGVYCGSVHVTSGKSWITDNALAVSDISDKLDFHYLAEALRFANLNQYSSQSGQPLISGNRIYPVKIIVPPKGLQKKFSMIFEKHLQLNKQVNHMIDPQNELFNSLVQQAFRGKL